MGLYFSISVMMNNCCVCMGEAGHDLSFISTVVSYQVSQCFRGDVVASDNTTGTELLAISTVCLWF